METTPLTTTPLTAFLAAILLHVAALAVFPRVGLLDFPERYGLTRGRLPYPTGVLSVAFVLLLHPSPRSFSFSFSVSEEQRGASACQAFGLSLALAEDCGDCSAFGLSVCGGSSSGFFIVRPPAFGVFEEAER